MFVSGLIVPIYTDLKGRRLALCVSVMVTGVSIIVLGLSPGVVFACICFFVVGFGFASIEIVSLVYCSEISGKRFRNHSMVALITVWGLSQVILGFIFAFMDYWRYIFIFVIGVPCLLCSVGAFVYFDETPRYLATKLMFDEAKIVFKRMANVNMRPPFMFKL